MTWVLPKKLSISFIKKKKQGKNLIILIIYYIYKFIQIICIRTSVISYV